MQKMLKAQEERELQQRREEREFQLRLLQLVMMGPVAAPAPTHAADDILALLSQLPK